MNNNHVFISYRRDGGDITAKLVSEALKNRGYQTFYDYDTLKGGVFDEQIKQEVINCSDVVLVLPKNALDRCVNEDDWVRQEISLALSSGKNIVPLMLDGFNFPEKLPDDIDKVRFYNGVRFHMDLFDAVVDKIAEMLTAKPLQGPKKQNENKPIDTPKNEPTTKGATHKNGVAFVISIDFWVVALAFYVLSLVFLGDFNLFLIFIQLGISFTAFGAFCLIKHLVSSTRAAIMCAITSLVTAILFLTFGIIFAKVFLLPCVAPFALLFVLLCVLFVILQLQPLGSKYVYLRKSKVSALKFSIVFIIVTLLICALIFVGVFPFFFKVQDKYLAEKGDAHAQYSTYLFYTNQLKDPEAGFMWLEKSLNNGCRHAANELADHYLSLKDYDLALELYLYGDYGIVSEDLKKIYELQSPELFTKEIDYANIDTISAFDIATMYYYGIRSEQNEELSEEIQFKLFEISADGGYPTAMYFLGKCYENGIGVEKDRSKALELYNQAIESGYAYNIASDIERVSK